MGSLLVCAVQQVSAAEYEMAGKVSTVPSVERQSKTKHAFAGGAGQGHKQREITRCIQSIPIYRLVSKVDMLCIISMLDSVPDTGQDE